MRKIKRWFLLLRGYIRCQVFHFCPKCNSDAPELYDCDVCYYYSNYSGGLAQRWLRKIWFNRYKKQLNDTRLR